MIVESNIRIQRTENSRLSQVDMNNIPFGKVFSDHMLVAEFRDGAWQQAEIRPFGPLPLAPSMSALNYGQAVFEGMKAFRTEIGDTVLFRPEENFKRLNRSAQRLSMPELPEEIFLGGLRDLIDLDRDWVPPSDKGALYIRPLMFATDNFIGVKASDNYMFVIFTCPVGPYYTEPVNLLVTKDFIRAATGGTGSAKAAGNYAGALLPDQLAKEQGYHNVLWLDARELTYIEECGTMNIFFVIDGKVATPTLSGTILPGITRNSCLQLLRDNGYDVEVRRLSIYEIREAWYAGKLDEVFGVGTAATIAPVAKIGFSGLDMTLPPMEDWKVAPWLQNTMADLRYGRIDDSYGWLEKV